MRTGTLLATTMALALAGVPATAPAPAEGSEDFAGRYLYEAEAQGYAEDFSAILTATPCGEGCVHVSTSSGGTDTEAHPEGPYWVFYRWADPGIRCDDGRVLPATMRYTFNPASSRGKLEAAGAVCGGVSKPALFTLTHVGDDFELPPPQERPVTEKKPAAHPPAGGGSADSGGH